MVSRLILILGDQLTRDIAALREADKSRDIVVMAEVMDEGTYVHHHPKKITLILSAMRHFAKLLQEDGWTVSYTRLDDPDASTSIVGELMRRGQEHGTTGAIATTPGEWRLIQALENAPLRMTILPDDRFIASQEEFDQWATGRKQLRMEYFYREMRRKTGLLMDGDKPVGGKWNFDRENRKKAQPDLLRSQPMRFTPDTMTKEVLDLVEEKFASNFGTLRPFHYAVTRTEALRALAHFIAHQLPDFGDTQDAMLCDDRFLNHSLLSVYINIGLLNPLEVCTRVAEAYSHGDVPINAAEGFIRQIIGWRDYVRGIYMREGPDYPTRNALDHTRDLPWMYWGGKTRMNCVSHAVAQTRDEAYAHHIQRLMVTGNFALLAGVDPQQLHEWYLAVYVDAFEWVEAPNTVGMSQWADAGIIASKPYVSSGAYIDRMSDYCGACGYSVKAKTGKDACPFNLLYWHFLTRHRDRFEGNPRMGQMYRTWDRMSDEKRETVIAEADALLERLDAGEVV